MKRRRRGEPTVRHRGRGTHDPRAAYHVRCWVQQHHVRMDAPQPVTPQQALQSCLSADVRMRAPPSPCLGHQAIAAGARRDSVEQTALEAAVGCFARQDGHVLLASRTATRYHRHVHHLHCATALPNDYMCQTRTGQLDQTSASGTKIAAHTPSDAARTSTGGGHRT